MEKHRDLHIGIISGGSPIKTTLKEIIRQNIDVCKIVVEEPKSTVKENIQLHSYWLPNDILLNQNEKGEDE